MRVVSKIAKYTIRDVVRSRSVIGFAVFLFLLTEALLRLDSGPKALLSLNNVLLAVVPLVSITFGTMYMYNGRPFLEMLLSHPVRRVDLFRGLFVGLLLPLTGAIVAGILLPFAIHRGAGAAAASVATTVGIGVALSAVFVSLAFAIATRFDDRVKGFGVSLLVWLMLCIVYDGVVLLVIRLFADYPVEKAVLGLMLLNPVDLARVLSLMTFDISALMGYTGAVFQRFLGTGLGVGVAVASLLAWVVIPLFVARRNFVARDF